MLTITSGGQTGVDRAALDAALELKVPIAGWCPRGRIAEDGVLSTRYALQETPTSRYPERTEWNVRDSDGTLILSYGRLLGGTALTARFAEKHRKPALRINLADPSERRNAASRILHWMTEAEVTRLNVAGPRASTSPEAYDHTARIVKRLIEIWRLSVGKPAKAKSSQLPNKRKAGRALSKNIANEDSPSDSSPLVGQVPSQNVKRRLSPSIHAMNPTEVKTIQRELPRWFARFGRELPWRQTADPYRIWISEIMLQQTTVTAVRPYYERFLARFPDLESLALSTEEDVLRLWEGLGYYSRGRNLRKAAQGVCDQHHGRFPETVAELMELPGIGRYVAGAVASFAFGKRTPIVEANTLRLYCRLLGYSDDPRNSQGQQVMWAFAESILPPSHVGDFNQALMDLGAMVCTPKSPSCPCCPLKTVCRAFASGTQLEIPRKASRPDVTDVTELTVAVMAGERVFIRRRGPQERWAGLWDFPRFACEPGHLSESQLVRMVTTHLQNEYGLSVAEVHPRIQIRHSVTRYRIDLRCYTANLCGEAVERLKDDESWVERDTLTERPMSVTGRKFAQKLVEPAGELPFGR